MDFNSEEEITENDGESLNLLTRVTQLLTLFEEENKKTPNNLEMVKLNKPYWMVKLNKRGRYFSLGWYLFMGLRPA